MPNGELLRRSKRSCKNEVVASMKKKNGPNLIVLFRDVKEDGIELCLSVDVVLLTSVVKFI
jgi:hypothetical protein